MSVRAFLCGAARVLDMGGVLGPRWGAVRRHGESDAQADSRALASDWQAVGDDLRAAALDLAEGEMEDVLRAIMRHADAITRAHDSAEVLRLTTEMCEQAKRLRRLSDTINATRRELRRR